MPEGFITKRGGYKRLLSYRKAEIIYDATVAFCARCIDKFSRTHDQMVQAARSGKQNIAEGCTASGTSKSTEIKLLGVARASLEELLNDYEDFLRTKNLIIWDKDHPKAQFIRKLGLVDDITYEAYRPYLEEKSAETAANTVICIIYQASYLLDKQLHALEQAFLKEGGTRERMTRARLNERNKNNSKDS